MSELNLLNIEKIIYIIRGQKVMLDSDLAELYGVDTKGLKRAVRRHLNRFPEDFMFELTKEEFENWRYQFGTSNREKMGLRVQPFVFTEGGVAMLSSVLHSDQAAQVNISIIRTFIRLRSYLAMEGSMNERLSKLEKGTNHLFKVVFERLDAVEEDAAPTLHPRRKKIGLKPRAY